ncbi:amino acid adenylation domain protein [Tolypothrix tenuis PCC 7101]|uniref:Amino acid adenylation domain protein n=1 Tax=Tolypothrix tenuis PCC 7101 TaxID=231146 RepID=A0A1Z4N0C2_9CYAN|nr:thioester reductase domain-containing protein [Aulosira sp. FACHB-113]BAY99149.1 amino acid adenylation domain protein [Tolypothrix tenuis PCC 7101]BAZ76928.1 amino acid adenylation domain protein [Aulosira laxa NIES-50]
MSVQNNNLKYLQSHSSIVSLLDFICQQYPDQVALVLEEQQLTYGELYQRAEHLYQYLTAKNWLTSNSLIGLCIEPSFEMVIAIYAVLKAGAAFVPLDPDLPRQRLSYMIVDAKLNTVLTQQKFAFDIEPALRQSGIDGNICFLDTPSVWQESTLPLVTPQLVEAEQLAYIIYTSGSTGVPKGVMLTHQGLLNLALASCSTFEIKPGLRLLQFASISFDAAIWEVVTALCGGATLVLGAREQMLPGKPLANFIARQKINWAMLPPSVLSTLTQFRDQLPYLQTVVVGGEACPTSLAKAWVSPLLGKINTILNKTCPASLAQSWISPHTRFFNAYGPTEITVCCTIYEFQPQDINLPIGYALPNVELYILDEELKLCNRGEKGELYVGGVGVAKGYLHKPDITNVSFIDNPFGLGKIYKTGDIVYEDPDHLGLLHYAGRTDNQVKIRGKRIELEAIEMVLAQHPGVQANTVKAIKTVQIETSNIPGNYGISMLVAYIVPKTGEFLTDKHLQRFAAEQLPDYMVPARFIFIDELPLLPNRSKVDRNALPELPQTPYFIANTIDNAVKIAAIFDQALQLPTGSCTPDTNFFHIGGNSLCIAHVLYAIDRDFSVSLPSRLIYEYPTPSDLAKLLEKYKLKINNIADEQQIDLQVEAKLSPQLNTSVWQQTPQNKYDCALITGATGFLGAHLLHELLQKGKYQKIYCIVRAESDTVAMTKLLATFVKYQLPTAELSQVYAIAGDIEQPQLQLPSVVFDKLGEEVDQIYHVAADTNYIKPYSAIKKPNVNGTANIIALAAHHRHKTLHYLSTLAVYGSLTSLLGINEVTEDFDIDISAPIMSVECGYIRSKWVAERMVKTAREQGLAVSIYRPGFISGHRQTGFANLNDTFYRFIRGCIQMGMYPDWPEKYWTPVPVDYVAALIASVSLDPKRTGGNYNIVVPRENEISNVEIFEFIHELGYPLQKISPKNWLNALSTLTPVNSLYPLTSFFQEKVYQNRSTILEVHHRTLILKVDDTLNAIKDYGIQCPTIDRALIYKYMPSFVADTSTEAIKVHTPFIEVP